MVRDGNSNDLGLRSAKNWNHETISEKTYHVFSALWQLHLGPLLCVFSPGGFHHGMRLELAY